MQAFSCAGGRGSKWPVHLPATSACPHVSPTLTRAASLHLPLAAASLGDTATPLGKAVRILNNQLQALTQVGGAPQQSEEGLWGVEGWEGFSPQCQLPACSHAGKSSNAANLLASLSSMTLPPSPLCCPADGCPHR